MKYLVFDAAAGKTIHLSGRITFADFSDFQTLTARLQDWGKGPLAVDLADVDFLDSSGLGMLMLLRDAAQARKQAFAFRNARGRVKRLMSLACVPLAA
jgi:anti-anti-sigma factor